MTTPPPAAPTQDAVLAAPGEYAELCSDLRLYCKTGDHNAARDLCYRSRAAIANIAA